MNFYKRFMGDYGKKTAHLSLMEHGAYTLLLDAIYATEKGLPADHVGLYRICRAMSKSEQGAVSRVADEFFPVGDDGLRHNERAAEEIEDAAPFIEAARSNGLKGGRPRKKPSDKPNGFLDDNPEQTHEKSSPEPKPSSPSLRSGERATRLAKDWSLPDAWREWAAAERPDLDIARTAATFSDHWHSEGGAKGRKLDWEGTWRNWVRREAAPKRGFQQPEPREWHESKSGVLAKAKELGLAVWNEIEEQWPTYRQRVMKAARGADRGLTLEQLMALAPKQGAPA